MMKLIVIFSFIVVQCTICWAEVLAPWPRTFWSQNKKFCLEVIPHKDPFNHPGNCRGVLYRVEGEKQKVIWSRYFPNDFSPTLVFISNDGEFIISVGDWGSVHTLPVVVYRENWLAKIHTVQSLGIDAPGSLVDPFNWGDNAKLFFGPKEQVFIVVLETGRPIIINRDGDVIGLRSLDLDKKRRATLLEFIRENEPAAKTVLQHLEQAEQRGAKGVQGDSVMGNSVKTGVKNQE